MIEAGQTVEMSTLIAQLGRASCQLDLPSPESSEDRTGSIAERCRSAVVVVARMFRLGESNCWRAAPASGFFITASGALVTSRHVVDCPDYQTIIVMTGDGRILPVVETLAADKESDVAILRVDAGRVPSLPLESGIAVGARVSVMSHTIGRYFTFTEGIVCRRSLLREGASPLEILEISAEFGPGGSGAPVVNERGNAVGWADALLWLPAVAGSGAGTSPKLIVRECGVSANIRRLVRKSP
jgi:S1-C subfamily serine protease